MGASAGGGGRPAGEGGVGVADMRRAPVAGELRLRGGGEGGGGGGDVLSREAFEALLPCIFHADAVHDEVRRGEEEVCYRVPGTRYWYWGRKYVERPSVNVKTKRPLHFRPEPMLFDPL